MDSGAQDIKYTSSAKSLQQETAPAKQASFVVSSMLAEPDTNTKTNTNNMIYTIAAIQQLGLRFSVDAVCIYSAELIVLATEILQKAVVSSVKEYADLPLFFDQANENALRNMLCTWRPTYCIDIFLHFDRNHKVLVGLPMLAETHPTCVSGLYWKRKRSAATGGEVDISSGNEKLSLALQQQTTFTVDEWHSFDIPNLRHGNYILSGTTYFTPDSENIAIVEIKYFSPEIVENAEDVPECVFFAHLTCDTDDADNNTLVALVYDVLLKDQHDTDNDHTTQQRYEYLRSISDALSRTVIGHACVRVQWAGDPCMYDHLQSLPLPHAHDKIVFYGNQREYAQYCFESVPEGTLPV